MGGGLLVPIIMVVGGGHVKFFLHCMGSFEKSAFLPPPIDLNGTALIKVRVCNFTNNFLY